jgi:hypothetical protein
MFLLLINIRNKSNNSFRLDRQRRSKFWRPFSTLHTFRCTSIWIPINIYSFIGRMWHVVVVFIDGHQCSLATDYLFNSVWFCQCSNIHSWYINLRSLLSSRSTCRTRSCHVPDIDWLSYWLSYNERCYIFLDERLRLANNETTHRNIRTIINICTWPIVYDTISARIVTRYSTFIESID